MPKFMNKMSLLATASAAALVLGASQVAASSLTMSDMGQGTAFGQGEIVLAQADTGATGGGSGAPWLACLLGRVHCAS